MSIKHYATVVFVGAALSQVGATDCGQITRDPGFDLWCGDSLCDWKVERGSVKEVPTWNEGDPGVELDGDDVAIEQFTPVDSFDGTCIQFNLIANIDDNAQVVLDVDIDSTGSDEQMEQLPTANWKPLSYVISVQAPFSGIRFEIAKRGAGNATLAEIDAFIVDDSVCAGLQSLTTGPQVDGELCTDGSDCASGICAVSPFPTPYDDTNSLLGSVVMTCEGCGSDTCGSGSVCGAGAPTSSVRAVPLECVVAASVPIGAQCATSAECTSGICSEYGFCSACGDLGAECGSGETCAQGWMQPVPGAGSGYVVTTGPFLCGPSSGKRQAGESCGLAADCASNVCNGTVREQCFDGRECANDYDCPVDGGVGSNALANGSCVTVGVQGGTCQ